MSLDQVTWARTRLNYMKGQTVSSKLFIAEPTSFCFLVLEQLEFESQNYPSEKKRNSAALRTRLEFWRLLLRVFNLIHIFLFVFRSLKLIPGQRLLIHNAFFPLYILLCCGVKAESRVRVAKSQNRTAIFACQHRDCDHRLSLVDSN